MHDPSIFDQLSDNVRIRPIVLNEQDPVAFVHLPRPLACLRYGEKEGRTLADLRLDPDATAVPLHDLLAYGQPDTGARIFILSMQSLEHLEQLVVILRIDADAVVLDRDGPLLIALLRSDLYSRRLWPVELDGVADEVLEHLR